MSSRNIFVKLDAYFRWRLKLSNDNGPFARTLQSLFRGYMRVGGRPSDVEANIGMRDGVVWRKGIAIRIETYAKNGPWASSEGGNVEYTLIAVAHSVPRFDFFQARQNDLQLALHPHCPVPLVNEANLVKIRRGIEQDYSATDRVD